MIRKGLVLLISLVCINTISSSQLDNHLNSTLDDFEPAEETQHTYCKIATEQLQATANATITRELRGVCTSKELKRSISAILREIQSLKDVLAISPQGGSRPTATRNKRKNLLNLFAVTNKDVINREVYQPPTHFAKHEGRYSYYWTLNNVEHYLYDGVSLKSPIITFQEKNYYLRLTIVDRVVGIHLLNKDHEEEVNYAIFVLGRGGSRDLRLDVVNDYSATLRRFRQFKHEDIIYIKLVIE